MIKHNISHAKHKGQNKYINILSVYVYVYVFASKFNYKFLNKKLLKFQEQ